MSRAVILAARRVLDWANLRRQAQTYTTGRVMAVAPTLAEGDFHSVGFRAAAAEPTVQHRD